MILISPLVRKERKSMRFIKRILGKIVYGIAVANRFILNGLVYLIETGILLAKSFLKGCLVLLSVGGCLFLLLLIPLGGWLLSNPLVLVILILVVAFPILGAIMMGRLKDYQEVSSRFFFGRAEYLRNPDGKTKRSYQYHKQAYYAEKAEQARREWERRVQQQRMWEERFRRWQGGFGGANGPGYGGAGSGYSSGSASNPYVDFKSKYEKSCATLGIPVTTEESRIKLAYRKKAKQYHPDVNSASDATAKFQEINQAYEFLNEDNIRRYKGMSGPSS